MPIAALSPPRRGLPPVHPGELFREDVLPALGKSKVELAALLRISRQSLYDFMDGKTAATPAMALRLGQLCGNGPELWMSLQAAWDLAQVRESLAGDLALIPTLQAVEAA